MTFMVAVFNGHTVRFRKGYTERENSMKLKDL
jgi:hypothetical protein